MAAFNWISIDDACPSCGQRGTIRAQTHVASDYGGDERGRFHDREYRLGDEMVWWPAGHPQFTAWKLGNAVHPPTDPDDDEEACHAAWRACGAELFVVLEFHDRRPTRVIQVGLERNWPATFLR